MRRVFVFAVVLLLLINLPEPRLAAAVTDAPDSAATPAPEAPPAPAKGSSEGRIPIGVGVKVSTLGIGGEVAVAVSHRSNVRFGFNSFSYRQRFGARRAELHVEQHQLRQRRRRSRIGNREAYGVQSRADASLRVWQFGAPQQAFQHVF